MNVQQCTRHRDALRGDALAEEISRLAAQIHAATYRWLVLIREFDALEAWGDQGCRSCAHWLNWRCGISLHTAREKVRVARKLQELSDVSAAFEQGRISYSKARAITRIAHAGNEAFLLSVALNGTASQLDRLVRLENRRQTVNEQWQQTIDAHAAREFSWYQADDGCIVFHGRLPKEQAARVIKALDRAQDENFATRDVPAGTPDERPSLDDCRADAVVRLADDYLAGKRAGSTKNDRYQVLLHVPAGTSTEPVRLSPGGTIPLESARRICCDAGIVPVVENAAGEPLSVGRKTRKIPPALRRALEVRDHGCCRFPACTNHRYLHGHHIKHWADGGETRLGNLVLLCSHHHRLVHEGGFGCDAMAKDRIVFRTPAGALLPEAYTVTSLDDMGQTPMDFEALQGDLNIGPDTCLPRFGGDRMDYDLALAALCERHPN